MTTVKRMKQNDMLPVLDVEVIYHDPDLSLSIPLVTPVKFTMTPVGSSTPKINKATASVVSSASGVVTLRYVWAVGDTDTVGDYLGEFEFTLNGDEPLTAPTRWAHHRAHRGRPGTTEPFRSAATTGAEAFEVVDAGETIWIFRVDAPDTAIRLDWATTLHLARWLVDWLDVPSV